MVHGSLGPLLTLSFATPVQISVHCTEYRSSAPLVILCCNAQWSRYFDDDDKFLKMWKEARQAAASSPRKPSRPPTVPTSETALDMPADDDDVEGDLGPFDSSVYDSVAGNPYADYVVDSPYDNVVDSDSRYDSVVDGDGGTVNKPFFIPDEDVESLEGAADSPELLARHVGVGGHGPLVADRLALLANLSASASSSSSSSSPRESGVDVGMRTVPKILPSLYFGDLRAGDVAATAETMELCHERGVQAFSLHYVGGEGGEEAGKGAAAAADYEYEDVSAVYENLLAYLLPANSLSHWVFSPCGVSHVCHSRSRA